MNNQPLWNKTTAIIGLLSLPLAACTDDFLIGEDIWFWLKVGFAAYLFYKLLSWLDSGGGNGGSSGCGGDSGGCDG